MFKLLSNFLQGLIDILGSALNFVVQIFPPSPFNIIGNSEFHSLISKINFFIPVYEFIAIGQAWLVAVGVYYLYAIFARWVKAIE